MNSDLDATNNFWNDIYCRLARLPNNNLKKILFEYAFLCQEKETSNNGATELAQRIRNNLLAKFTSDAIVQYLDAFEEMNAKKDSVVNTGYFMKPFNSTWRKISRTVTWSQKPKVRLGAAEAYIRAQICNDEQPAPLPKSDSSAAYLV